MKPTEPRWGLMWHNHFEVLFVFTGWPTPHQKESPSPNWSASKLWGARKRYNRFRSWIPHKLLCSTEIALVGLPPVQAESGEPGNTKTASAWALTSDCHITVGAESTALSPSSWQSPAIWGSTRIQIALTLALGQSHFPDKMLKMAIKVTRTQIYFMPSLLTLHGPIVLADMQPRFPGTEDKLVKRRKRQVKAQFCSVSLIWHLLSALPFSHCSPACTERFTGVLGSKR